MAIQDGTTGRPFSASSPGPTQVREFHFYDDLDQNEGSHHHTIGEGPTQGVSWPRAQALADLRFSPLGHLHPSEDGVELVDNGDFSGGSSGWIDSFWNTNASWAVAAGVLTTSVTADDGFAWAGQNSDDCVAGETLIVTYELWAEYANQKFELYMMSSNSTDETEPSFFMGSLVTYDVPNVYIVPEGLEQT